MSTTIVHTGQAIGWYRCNGKDCPVCYKPNPHAKALGKLGGKVRSPAKAAAARKNGKKGGRPKLSSIGRGK